MVLGSRALELITQLNNHTIKNLTHLKNFVMKKILIKICFVCIAAIGMQLPSQAQFVVKLRPTVVVRARPLAPSPRHVWVEGEYVQRGNQYEYTEGHWVLPAYPGARWVPGHWKENRRRGGWYWAPGHWRRR